MCRPCFLWGDIVSQLKTFLCYLGNGGVWKVDGAHVLVILKLTGFEEDVIQLTFGHVPVLRTLRYE